MSSDQRPRRAAAVSGELGGALSAGFVQAGSVQVGLVQVGLVQVGLVQAGSAHVLVILPQIEGARA